jgi:hypothetical protein
MIALMAEKSMSWCSMIGKSNIAIRTVRIIPTVLTYPCSTGSSSIVEKPYSFSSYISSLKTLEKLM